MRIIADETLLTNKDANSLLGSPAQIDGDVSLEALLRAIVWEHRSEKMKPTDVSVKSCVCFAGSNRVSDIKAYADGYDYPLTIIELRQNFEEVPNLEGWTTYDGAPFYLNRYLSQITRSKVFCHKDKQRILAVVDKKVTHIWVQALESFLWVLMPWYYPEKSDAVIAFFKKLSVNTKSYSELEAHSALIEYVNKIGASFDCRSLRLHSLLDGLADFARQNQLTVLRDTIKRTKDSISQYMSSLSTLYNNLERDTTTLKGLENIKPNEDNSLFDFFNQHKNLSVVTTSSSGAELRYSVESTLEFYDVDELKATIDNKYSWINSNFRKDFIQYIRLLFVEKRGLIRVGADFKLSNMKLVAPIKGSLSNQSVMPNPHVYFFGCSGGNDVYYSKYAQSGDWELAIEQSISATKNWNIGDSAVGRRMLNWLCDYSEKQCIYVNADCSPVDKITSDTRLVSFQTFKRMMYDNNLIPNDKGENNNGEENNDLEF